MAIGDVVNSTSILGAEAVKQLGQIGLWLQALGIIVLLWIVVHVINLLINRKKIKTLKSIKENMIRIEKKIDKVLKNTKK